MHIKKNEILEQKLMDQHYRIRQLQETLSELCSSMRNWGIKNLH